MFISRRKYVELHERLAKAESEAKANLMLANAFRAEADRHLQMIEYPKQDS